MPLLAAEILLHLESRKEHHCQCRWPRHPPFEGASDAAAIRKAEGSGRTSGKDCGLRVVIADDHGLMVEGTKRALEEAGGFEIVGEASNGAQVLPLIRR